MRRRAKAPAISTTQGATILDTLSQSAGLGYAQTFQTGTNFQANVSGSKIATNSSNQFVNPSLSTNLQFTLTQPLQALSVGVRIFNNTGQTATFSITVDEVPNGR